jgi:peroxiredoxin
MSGEDWDRYVATARGSREGREIAYDDFIHHFDVQNANPRKGIATGSPVPSFSLADQGGRPRTFENLTGPRGLLIVFVRSANWCGYCRNQLVELNHAAENIAVHGVRIAAIAPDPWRLTRDFAEYAGLKYPLLADENGNSFVDFDIINENIPADFMKESLKENAASGRIPFPAHFLFARDGTLKAKAVSDDLRHRLSGTSLVFKELGKGAGGLSIEMTTEDLRGEVTLASSRLLPGQEVAVRLALAPAAGMHIYGPLAPAPYSPLCISFGADLVCRQHFAYPEPEVIAFEALHESIPVYRQPISIDGTIRLNWSPPVHGSRHLHGLEAQLAALATAPGDHTLRCSIAYQSCTTTSCRPPARIDIEIPITIAPDIDKVSPVFEEEWKNIK